MERAHTAPIAQNDGLARDTHHLSAARLSMGIADASPAKTGYAPLHPSYDLQIFFLKIALDRIFRVIGNPHQPRS